MRFRFLGLFLILILCAVGAFGAGRAAPDSLVTALQTGDLFRLHVVANSDGEADQRIKLRVRDEVLQALRPAMQACQSAAEAEACVTGSQERLLQAVKEAGWTGPVRLEIGTMPFPDRTYNGTLVPAGEYRGLKIILGQGEGHNWWCVLYPTLCFGSLTENEPVHLESAVLRWVRARLQKREGRT